MARLYIGCRRIIEHALAKTVPQGGILPRTGLASFLGNDHQAQFAGRDDTGSRWRKHAISTWHDATRTRLLISMRETWIKDGKSLVATSPGDPRRRLHFVDSYMSRWHGKATTWGYGP